MTDELLETPENEDYPDNKNDLPDNEAILALLKPHQNFLYAVIGGLLTALVGAVIWACITVTFEYQIGFMAIVIGLLTGFSVRFFGAGIDQKFGILGGALSLFSCMLGNLFTQIGFIAHQHSYGYIETLSYLDWSATTNIMIESFSPIDLLFYGFAIYEGYKFSFREITKEVIANNGYSSYMRLRIPLILTFIALLSLILFKSNSGANGLKKYTYPSGRIMSEGEMKNSKEEGKWIFYNENDKIEAVGYFTNGARDGIWQWYDTLGNITCVGHYKNGLEHGIWMNYHQNGSLMDSVCYTNGRMINAYISRYEDGRIFQSGYYNQSEKDSIWKTYFPNGQLNTIGKMKKNECVGEWFTYYDNGKPAEEVVYDPNHNAYIRNIWDSNGKQLIINGNGQYKSYSDQGILLSSGEIRNGKKNGKWDLFFENEKRMEERMYENNTHKTLNAWDPEGKQMIENGNGIYTTYYLNTTSISGTVEIKDGLPNGLWCQYYQSDTAVIGSILQEFTYLAGKMTGAVRIFYEDGTVYLEGEMKNDLKEGKWKWYHISGNLNSSVEFRQNKKEGTQITLNEKGEKIKEEIYKNGVLIETIL